MPYVQDTSVDPDLFIEVERGSSKSTTSTRNGRHRSQFGYRSIQLSEAEVTSIEANLSSTHANQLSHIALLDESSGEVAYRKHDMRFWPTNDRDYTETAYYPQVFKLVEDIRPYPYTNPSLLGLKGFLSCNLLPGAIYSAPSDTAARSIAGQLLRGSRPPVEQFNLARFAMEQKDARLLLKMENYIPRSPRHLGSAVLNFLFGLKPTGEDLGRAAALAIKSEPVIRGLIGLEKVRERRYNEREIAREEQSGTFELTSYDVTSAGTSVTTGYHTNRIVLPGYYGTSGSYGNVLRPSFTWSYVRQQRIRSFATWEYFVPRPLGLEERLPTYRLAAESLLRTWKFDEAVVYDLTPWTWLGNWFADFGGLLRYQRAIIDNQQVMSDGGYSVLTDYVGQVTFAGITPTSKNGQYPYFKGTVKSLEPSTPTATVRYKSVKRRASSPYAVGPTWDFSQQQWAILGALGLARGPNAPNIRV